MDFVRFAQAKSMTLAPSCHIRFAGGDDLFGSLVSLDGETLEFNTWFGGTLKIPRAAIQTITFLPRNYSLVYEGPADASDWVVTAASAAAERRPHSRRSCERGVVIIQNGVVIDRARTQSAWPRSGPAGPPNWTYRDGGFVTAGAGTLGRNFNLTGSSTVEFDLASNGPFNLLLDLYSTSAASRGAINNKSLMLTMDQQPNHVASGRPRGIPTSSAPPT